MTRVIRLQLILSVTGAVLVAALIGSRALGQTAATAPDVGGAYVEGVTGQPMFLNPLLAATTDYPAQSIDALLYSGLVKEDASGQAQPDLAESWNISADGKQYTFYLRTNARWQDGQPVTADDVLYTVGTIQAPDFPGNPDLAAAWQGVRVSKLDSMTVQFSRNEPFAPFLDYASVGILPAHLLAQVAPRDLPGNAFNRQPVGTGPYALRQLDLRTATLEVSPQYYGPKPYISRVMFRFYKDDASVTQALIHGDILGDWHVDATQAKALQFDQNVRFYSAEQPSFSGLCFNLADPIFSQLPVRQAVAYGINRDMLNRQLLGGLERVDDSPISAESWAYDPQAKHYGYDPAQAAKVLDDAGWTAGADGVRSKGGQRLTAVVLTSDLPDHVALANAIAQQLKGVGMDATVQSVGFDGLVRDFLAPRKFQVALVDWDEPGSDPDPYPLWHSSQATEEGLNFSAWKNPAADQQLEMGRKSTDQDTRKKAYSTFQSIFASELPAFLLFHPVYQYAVDSSVQGVTLPAAIHPWDRFQTEAQWFMKTKPSSR
ncbi:MAG: peptide ABC transporter substrate-binding protein [Chloroflexi bacterium]|nr:peptide ABC transporter substrate-binding protein [Chloroflexota bacterium]